MSTTRDDVVTGALQHATGVPGWYGKLPCLGDFASRRLPAEFIERWDAWLQRSLAASRAQLGEAWLDIFLTSPMWRFVLSPGLCGEHAYAGLMLPSVDKVGRYFPLTLALPLAAAQAQIAHILEQQVWYSELERVGLAALTVDFSPAALERALSENPFSFDPAAANAAHARELLECLRDTPGTPRSFRIANIDTLPAAVAAGTREILAEHAGGKSYWWSVEHDTGATEFHCSSGLPPPEYFRVLLDGYQVTQTMSIDPLQAFDPTGTR